MGSLPSRRYAVIIDEAHSSQTGEAAKDLKKVLGAAGIDPETELAQAEAAEASLATEVGNPAEEALLAEVAAQQVAWANDEKSFGEVRWGTA